MVRGALLFPEQLSLGGLEEHHEQVSHDVLSGGSSDGYGIPVHRVSGRAQRRHEVLASLHSESFPTEPLAAPWPACTGLTSHYQIVSAALSGRRAQGAD